LHGYVDDLLGELASGAVYTAPIAAGSGVKNKVLDAMNCGLPVVGTFEAFSGLKVTPGVHCVICPRDQMSDRVIELLRDPSLRKEMGEAAKDWVVRNLDWDIQAARLEAVLQACQDRGLGTWKNLHS